MASEAAYPYKQALGTCPSSYTKFFQGKIADLSVTTHKYIDIFYTILQEPPSPAATGPSRAARTS